MAIKPSEKQLKQWEKEDLTVDNLKCKASVKNNNIIVVGIDPGLQGYMTALDYETGKHLWSNPLNEITGHGVQIYNTLKERRVKKVFLERVMQGHISTAIMYGEMLFAIKMLGFDFGEIRAVDWKRWNNLLTPGVKKKKLRKLPTVELCEKKWPGTYFRTIAGALLDGKADSCMVAETGRMLLGGKI